MKKADIEKFYAAAARAGFDREQAHTVLGVKSLHEFSGHIGQALTMINEARQAAREGREMEVLVLPEDERRALYPSDELARRGAMVRAFAPFAHGNEPVTDQEIALTVIRGEEMGVDVFNHHEVEIWKDKKGRFYFQLSYVLIRQWIAEFHSGHTKPRYTLLTDEEKETRGIKLEDQAVRCSFVMKSDISLLAAMIEAGWDALEARQDMTVEGIGVVAIADWNATAHGREYFAPNGRDKMFKLENRAYTDAIRRKFGEPSPSAIYQLRRARGEETIEQADWEVANGETNGDARVRHAQAAARTRQHEPTEGEILEEVLEKNRTALHGDAADQEGLLIREEPEEPPEPEPETEPDPEPDPEPFEPPRPWSPKVLRERMERKVASLIEEKFAFERGKLKNFQGAVRNSLELCFAGEEDSTPKRHRVGNYLVGKGSSSRWNAAETKALHLWMAAKPDSTGEWYPSLVSTVEAQAIASRDPNAESNTRAGLTQTWEKLWAKAKLEIELGTVVLDDLPTTSPTMDNEEYTAQIESLETILKEAKGNVGA